MPASLDVSERRARYAWYANGPPPPPCHLPSALVEAPVADEPRGGGRHATEHGRPRRRVVIYSLTHHTHTHA